MFTASTSIRDSKRPQVAAAVALSLVLAAILLAIAGPARAASIPRSAAACPSQNAVPDNARGARRGVLCLLNAVRRERGLAPLRQNAKLQRAAKRYTRHMLRRDCFSHDCPGAPTLGRRVLGTGYAGRSAYLIGENLGWGSGTNETPRSMTIMWMRSPGHRANILRRDFREVGIGVAIGHFQHERRAAVYTTEFGRRY